MNLISLSRLGGFLEEGQAVGVKYYVRLQEFDNAKAEAGRLAVGTSRVALRGALRALLRRLRQGVISRMPPKRSGNLRRSIRTKIKVNRVLQMQARLTVGTGLDKSNPKGKFYAQMLEAGTGKFGPVRREFTIRPSTKKALRIPGLPHPVAYVRIKGIRPLRFVQRTEREDMDAARQAFNDEFQAQLRKLGTRVWNIY